MVTDGQSLMHLLMTNRQMANRLQWVMESLKDISVIPVTDQEAEEALMVSVVAESLVQPTTVVSVSLLRVIKGVLHELLRQEQRLLGSAYD